MDVELPILEIAGIQFTVDLNNEWLFESANPVNFISFNELEETGQDFRMVFDPQTRNIFKGDEDEIILRGDLKYIVLKELKWMPAFGFVWSLPQNDIRLKIGR
jgi:hypothetical protein